MRKAEEMMQTKEEKKDRWSIGKKKDILKSEVKKIVKSIRMRLSRKIKMESRKKRV